MMYKAVQYSFFGVVLFLGLTSFLMMSFWLGNERIPNLIKPVDGLIFDYIIVGAGTAGSVLANRLSQDTNSTVLLIEAGHTFGIFSKVPLLTTFAQKTTNDWGFYSEPQMHSSRGLLKQMQYLPRGKGLGGSAQLNYMLHFEGHKRDFDFWKFMGIKGWEYSSMRKYLSTSRACHSIPISSSSFTHSSDFCCSFTSENETATENDIFTIPANYSKISEAFTKTGNFFPQEEVNFRLSKYNIKKGVRWSAYESFLRPAFERGNLKILTNSEVHKIQLDNGVAQSVLVKVKDGDIEQKMEYFSRKEIILSSGAFQTPQLLQLSGIGSEKDLKRIGTKPVVKMPRVGLNLHDHINFPLFATINVSASITVDKILNLREIYDYLTKGKGIFANFGVIGHIDAVKDRFGIGIFATGSVDEKALKDLSNFKQEAFRSLFPFYFNQSQEGLIFLTTCYHPKSRGSVHARTSKFEDAPAINPNFLHDADDVKCMIRGIRMIVEIAKSKPFQEVGVKLHWPKLSMCSNLGPFEKDFLTNNPSDRYLECAIRAVGLTSHHPGGTCSIGKDKNSGVVDSKLRVHGVKGLRIVDASILPTPISGVPNSVISGMAKRAADLILGVI